MLVANTPPATRIALASKSLIFLFLSAFEADAAPSIGGVVNAATFKVGGLAPGTLVSIFGSG